MQKFAIAVTIFLCGCGSKGDDTESGPVTGTATTGTATTGTATTGEATTGEATSTGVPTTGDVTGPATCAEATDAAQCAAVVQDDLLGKGCLWAPLFAVTQEADACTFEPAGGKCLAPVAGDTDCNSYAAPCGFDAYFGKDAGGNTLIARIDDGCSYFFSEDLSLAWCMDPNPTPDPLESLACSCACAANWPA